MERRTAKDIVHDYQSNDISPNDIFISENDIEEWVLSELRYEEVQKREFDKGYFKALRKINEMVKNG
jgi:hypothetical protein